MENHCYFPVSDRCRTKTAYFHNTRFVWMLITSGNCWHILDLLCVYRHYKRWNCLPNNTIRKISLKSASKANQAVPGMLSQRRGWNYPPCDLHVARFESLQEALTSQQLRRCAQQVSVQTLERFVEKSWLYRLLLHCNIYLYKASFCAERYHCALKIHV